MAIWLTKQRATSGVVFGSTDKFDGLGVFIDTYKNHRPGTVFPYVMAMIGNSSITYDKDNDGQANELAGCSVYLALPQCIHQVLTKAHRLAALEQLLSPRKLA